MNFLSDQQLELLKNSIQTATTAKTSNKSHVIILLPIDFSVNDIKIIISELKINGFNSRLYDRRRLQIYFNSEPKRSPAEILMNKQVITDIDENIKFIYDEFDKLVI